MSEERNYGIVLRIGFLVVFTIGILFPLFSTASASEHSQASNTTTINPLFPDGQVSSFSWIFYKTPVWDSGRLLSKVVTIEVKREVITLNIGISVLKKTVPSLEGLLANSVRSVLVASVGNFDAALTSSTNLVHRPQSRVVQPESVTVLSYLLAPSLVLLLLLALHLPSPLGTTGGSSIGVVPVQLCTVLNSVNRSSVHAETIRFDPLRVFRVIGPWGNTA